MLPHFRGYTTLMSTHNGFIKYASLLLPFFAAGCSTLRVQTDHVHSVNFSQYHTYSWVRVKAGNQLWADRIRRNVDAQLAARGWKEVPNGGQAAIAAFSSTRNEPTYQTFYTGFGPGFGPGFGGPGCCGWGWGAGFTDGFATTQVINTPIGTLVVDVFDSSSRKLIWHGVSDQVLSGNPQKNESKLARAVSKMFRNFPPPTTAAWLQPNPRADERRAS